jgi:hypothetical protein
MPALQFSAADSVYLNEATEVAPSGFKGSWPTGRGRTRKETVMTGKRSTALFFALFTLITNASGAAHERDGRSDNGEDRRRPIVWDVAIDCRTWRFNGGIPTAEFGRGDSFLADGTIFPAGTLQAGAQINDPNDPGSIGKWTQRGVMAATLAAIVSGTRPAFFATWFHLLTDGSGLVVDGPHPESGPMAVVGGMGRFSGATGELSDEIIGSNSTGCPNLRLTVTLKKQAPR